VVVTRSKASGGCARVQPRHAFFAVDGCDVPMKAFRFGRRSLTGYYS
jgi:hypothetical protein